MRNTILIGLILALFLFAACTPEAQTPEEPAQTDTSAEAEVEVETNVEADVEEQVEETTSNLADFFRMKDEIEYQVTYDFSSNMNGQTQSGEMDQYMKGSERVRTDSRFGDSESSVLLLEGEAIICSKQDEWTCFSSGEQEEQDPAEAVQEDVESNPEDYDITELPGRTIAGTSTSCFAVDTEQGSVEYCYSDEGVPLYVKSEGSAEGTTYSSEMVATSYSTSVANSAFEPPAEVTSFEQNYEDLIAQYR